jgi:tetratricopeptide (TPR) repeat protein
MNDQQLGFLAYQRFKAAHAAGAPEAEQTQHLNRAIQHYHQTLDQLSADQLAERAGAHYMLGVIYKNAGQPDLAQTHYDHAIPYFERVGRVYEAAKTRYNAALLLWEAGHTADALIYAESALRGYQSAANAEAEIHDVRHLMRQIKAALRTSP